MTDHLKEGGKSYTTHVLPDASSVSIDAGSFNDNAFDFMESIEKRENVDIASMDDDAFKGFKDRWHDPDIRKHSDFQSGLLEDKYMTRPAGFTGFIEESADMRNDVMAAAEETGVDPNFLFNVTMQEGMAYKMSERYKARQIQNTANDKLPGGGLKESERIQIYKTDREYDTYTGIGLDALFLDQQLAVDRGYLNESIETKDLLTEVFNEKADEFLRGTVDAKDAWRGVGAMIRLNKDYMTSQFKKRGLDFSKLSQDDQNFWTYAAYNAGAGDAGKKLLDVYGPNPTENKEWRRTVKSQKKQGNIEVEEGLAFWMHNVGRVVGGTRTTNIFSPFGASTE